MVQPHIGGGKMHAAIIALMEILNRTFLPLTVQQVERPEKRLVNAHFRCVHIRAEGLFPFRTEKVSKLLLYQGLELLLRAAAQKDRAADAAEEQHPVRMALSAVSCTAKYETVPLNAPKRPTRIQMRDIF